MRVTYDAFVCDACNKKVTSEDQEWNLESCGTYPPSGWLLIQVSGAASSRHICATCARKMLQTLPIDLRGPYR